MRALAYEVLNNLRSTPLRRPIMALLVRLHNLSYHLISFFASYSGTHPKHRLMDYHAFFAGNVSATDVVLDVGCGKGEVARTVAQKAKKVVGIDFSPESIAIAKRAAGTTPNLSFIIGDATTYEFSQKFDAIILSNVLEHIQYRVDFLKKLSHVAPKILIRVPMVTRDWITLYKKEQGFEYRLDDTHYLEYDIPTFQNEIKAAQLRIAHYHVNFGELYAVVTRS